MIEQELSIIEIQKIYKKLSSYIQRTPILLNNNISNKLNTEIILKLEFLQYGGTFKSRGALNNILNLTNEEKNKYSPSTQ